jgi:hypothetical protein
MAPKVTTDPEVTQLVKASGFNLESADVLDRRR